MSEESTELSEEATLYLLKNFDLDPNQIKRAREFARSLGITDLSHLTGGKKEHREFIAKTLDKIAKGEIEIEADASLNDSRLIDPLPYPKVVSEQAQDEQPPSLKDQLTAIVLDKIDDWDPPLNADNRIIKRTGRAQVYRVDDRQFQYDILRAARSTRRWVERCEIPYDLLRFPDGIEIVAKMIDRCVGDLFAQFTHLRRRFIEHLSVENAVLILQEDPDKEYVLNETDPGRPSVHFHMFEERATQTQVCLFWIEIRFLEEKQSDIPALAAKQPWGEGELAYPSASQQIPERAVEFLNPGHVARVLEAHEEE